MSALGDFFKEVADAIRSKTGKTEPIKPIDFPLEILGIQSGGSGGSSSTDVASISITTPNKYYSIGYKTYVNGVFGYQTAPNFAFNLTSFTANNCCVGSELYLQVTDLNYMSVRTVTVTGDIEVCANKSDCVVIKATSSNGGTVKIS